MSLPEPNVVFDLYKSGKSIRVLAKEYDVSEKTVGNVLHKMPNWNSIKNEVRVLQLAIKAEARLFVGVCETCGNEFKSKRKRKYCSKKCRLLPWNRNYRKENKDVINESKRIRRAMKEKKLSVKKEWEQKFLEKIQTVHKRNLNEVVKKILQKIESRKNSLVTRSNKLGLRCTITQEDLRQLFYENYGQPCKYCGRILDHHNMVVDHIIPVSKGGEATPENLQVICKTSNSMKGSLDEQSFYILLDWLKTIPSDLSKDISIRLARGIH